MHVHQKPTLFSIVTGTASTTGGRPPNMPAGPWKAAAGRGQIAAVSSATAAAPDNSRRRSMPRRCCPPATPAAAAASAPASVPCCLASDCKMSRRRCAASASSAALPLPPSLLGPLGPLLAEASTRSGRRAAAAGERRGAAARRGAARTVLRLMPSRPRARARCMAGCGALPVEATLLLPPLPPLPPPARGVTGASSDT